MKRLLGLLVLLSLLVLPTRGLADTYVLAIGIADYPTPTDSKGASLKDDNGDPIDNDLRGCVNDAKAFESLLADKFAVSRSNIRRLTDKQATIDNLIAALKWLISSSKPGDQVFFFFSGHGVQLMVQDRTIESDGKEEALVLYDGLLVDDSLKEIADLFAEEGRHFYAVLDSCFSGGMSRTVARRTKSVNQLHVQGIKSHRLLPAKVGAVQKMEESAKAPVTGSFTLIAAGQEGQPTIDASFTDGRLSQGIFTFVFTTIVAERPGKTLRAAIQESADLLKEAKFDQVPKIESTLPGRLDLPLVFKGPIVSQVRAR